ncbi:hypothetical protein GCM10011345_32970 [Gemmobacter megaterium]|uniref:hypothetical protein n=1 Tax=Gemmobacter megaterium TaxID=1086013 RepID=UPI001181B89F|nr:hypothetical protein [Gemmobacter megaterium]GGE24415.1 hypothetical protein GCM10011345_32970 [Gemmobacter megaterium]
MRTLQLAAACLLVASCGSTATDAPRHAPPPSLILPCAVPVALPERSLTDQEVEVFWGRDRAALRACGSRQAGLAGWVQVGSH